ncbi:MAG: chemotaxis protein CheW [Myxococcales bacterium]
MKAAHKYLPLFVADANEQLEALSGEIVRLEKETPERGLWDSIFRRVHSVKGSAATLGFTGIVDIAHHAEDLIGRMRAVSEKPSRAQIDLLFEATDALQKDVRRVAADPDDARAAPRELVSRLLSAAQALPDPAAAPLPSRKVVEAEDAPSTSSLPRFEISVCLMKTCAAPGARALIVQRKLRALGTLIEMDPLPAQLMSQRGGAAISASLATDKSIDEVRKALSALPEVESADVRSAGAARTTSQPAPAPAQVQEMPAIVPPPQTSDTDGLRPESMVRVRAETLDQLLDQAAEVLHGIARLRDAAKRLPQDVGPVFEAEVDRLRRTARDLHGRVMNARLTPFSALTERLPRAVRDLSHRLGKEVDLEVQGADVELDRTVIEALGDPLSHLVRNAIDHGIEDPKTREAAGKAPRGKLTLSARRERDKVVVEIADDGGGLDAEALRRKAITSGAMSKEAANALSENEVLELAFLPGVSTRETATDVSGRGVGLDAVQRAVEALGGAIKIRSARGAGATFSLELPLNVSMANLLLVQVAGELYGIPLHRVLVTTEYDLTARGGEGFEARSLVVLGQLVRAYALAKLFGLPSLLPPGPRPFVVMEQDGALFALSVDRLVGQEEAVLKPLFPPLDRVRGLAGVTVLGNGRPLLVLDPRGIAELAGIHEPVRATKGAA